MIDFKSVDQTINGCGFVHALIKKPKKDAAEEKRFEDSLSVVMRCIKRYKNITRVEILKRVELSMPTVDKCLTFLVNHKEIKRFTMGSRTPLLKRTFSPTSKAREVY